VAKWTLEQLKHLQDLEASVSPVGTIHIIPISKGGIDEGYSSNLTWDARLYKKGVMGPLPVDEVNLEACGVPSDQAADWVRKTEKAVATLSRLYPVLTVGIEERVRAIESSIPVALPAGEVELAEGVK